MRIKSLKAQGFRGFSRLVEFDLDAQVVLIQGPNGVGKTSFFDAILWAITGKIERFLDRGGPVSVYASEGLARVQLDLAGDDGDISIVRAIAPGRNSFRLTTPTGVLEGDAAEAAVSKLLLPQLHGGAQATAISSVLTRGVYLQQDMIRGFVEADTAVQRFSLISEVVGSGATLELQNWLEKSRASWSRATTAARKEELGPLEDRLEVLDIEVRRLGTTETSEDLGIRGRAESLYRQATELVGGDRLPTKEPPQTSAALDRLLRELSAEKVRLDRDAAGIRQLREEVTSLADARAGDERSEAEMTLAETDLAKRLEQGEEAIKQELQKVDQAHAALLSNRDRASRLGTMATVALEGLGDICPVCQQVHDVAITRVHLEELISIAAGLSAAPLAVDRSALDEASVAQGKLRVEYETLSGNLLRARARAAELRTNRESVSNRAKELGVSDDGELAKALESHSEGLSVRLASLEKLLAEGEALSLLVVRLGEQRRRAELEKEMSALLPKVSELSSNVDLRDRAHSLAGKIIDALRDANLEFTRKQIDRIQPLLQRIYSRIDPHPTFRVTQLVAEMERGRGQLKTGVSDPDFDAIVHDAIPLLSSSQLNSFAVSLFLAMNLGLPSMKLATVMLDDPLQSLDAINLLGLVDVLRRFKAHRQLVVSTHDPRLLGLLQRKLRPTGHTERMIAVTFSDWNRDGPTFEVSETFVQSEERVLAA